MTFEPLELSWQSVGQFNHRLYAKIRLSAPNRKQPASRAYRLYTIFERKKRAREALSYNSLVQSWPEIMRMAQEEKRPLRDMNLSENH